MSNFAAILDWIKKLKRYWLKEHALAQNAPVGSNEPPQVRPIEERIKDLAAKSSLRRQVASKPPKRVKTKG